MTHWFTPRLDGSATESPMKRVRATMRGRVNCGTELIEGGPETVGTHTTLAKTS
jgi:hypothetical protein